MQRNLLLKERLNGLRKERKLTLEDVEKGTGIPKSTLHRLENDSPDLNAHETRVGYQDIVAHDFCFPKTRFARRYLPVSVSEIL